MIDWSKGACYQRQNNPFEPANFNPMKSCMESENSLHPTRLNFGSAGVSDRSRPIQYIGPFHIPFAAPNWSKSGNVAESFRIGGINNFAPVPFSATFMRFLQAIQYSNRKVADVVRLKETHVQQPVNF